MDRATKITYQIEEGYDILIQGHYLSWELWNVLCHTFTGNGYRKYEGKYTVSKTLRKLPQAIKLSDRCFSSILEQFDIAMRSWWSNLKSNPDARPPKPSRNPRNLKFQVGRNAKPIGNFKYRLTVLGGTIKERHAIIQIFVKPGLKMSQVKWIELKPDNTGSLNYEIETRPVKGRNIAAIDLGIINIATIAFNTGESIMISGKGLLASNQWANKQASKCKPANWSKGKKQERTSKRFKQYRKKAGNTQKLAVHNLTRFIVDECVKRDVNQLIVGDLKGIRDNANHGKRGNQRLHNWPFYQITKQLKYKGAEYGIEIIKRSERNTSKLHHFTKEKGIRNPRGLIKFDNEIINSDVNGAFGILNNYLEEIEQSKVSPALKVGVAAILPGLPSPDCDSEKSIQGPSNQRTGKVSQIGPTFVAKFDLRNWSLTQTHCNTKCSDLQSLSC